MAHAIKQQQFPIALKQFIAAATAPQGLHGSDPAVAIQLELELDPATPSSPLRLSTRLR